MEMVNIKIDGRDLSVEKGITVLEAAQQANIEIPTLCFLKHINQIGACRMCVVEIKGARSLQASCVYPVAEGLEIQTNTKAVRESRRVTLELILSEHDRKCLTCVRNNNCELQTMADKLNIGEIRFEGEQHERPIDDLSPSIVRNPNKCILCKRCVSVCQNVQSVSAISATERGFETVIASPFEKSLNEGTCVNCGQCIAVCPVGALSEKSSIEDVWSAMDNSDLHVVVQTAPAVRAAIGEEFGLSMGTPVTGKMVAALRRMGFAKVFDTDTGADLTIMEEGTELISRLKSGKNLPIITSCSPGWIKFCEHNFPEFLDNLSTCKSPHQMFGAILKSYYAEKNNINPEKIFVVSVMPCTAKKFESEREEMKGTGYNDVDAVITTRELAKMIKQAGIDFVNLPDEEFDNPFGGASGAAVIFGATGGVTEAALRTVYEIVTGKTLEKVEFESVRGTEGLKEAQIDLDGIKVRIAVVSGLGNARKLMDDIKEGKAQYEFVEVMACPGGCVTGGGQPILPAKTYMDVDVKAQRAKALYTEDQNLTLRKSHENPSIKKLYEEYLGEPNGHKSHKLLHTHYEKRSKI